MNYLSSYPVETSIKTHGELFSKFSIFLILLIFQSTADAQNSYWRVFRTQNSQLPSNIIGNIVIDRNNVKWIGTPEGMVKIEGDNWTIFDTSNTPLGDNSIAPKLIDEFNNLWVGVAYKGIAKYNGFNWTIYDTTNSGLPSNAVADIQSDVQNIKWIATNKGIAKFDGTNWTVFDTSNSGLPDNSTSTIAIENNVKWIGTNALFGGMARFDDTSWVIYNMSNSQIPNNTINDVSIDNWGIKWVSTYWGTGVGRYNSVTNTWTVYNTYNSGLPNGYVFFTIPHNHIKWIGTEGGGLAKFNDTNWVVFNTANSPIPNNSVICLGIDSLGNLWIGTGGGLAIYNQNGIIGVNYNSEITTVNFILYQNYPNPFNPVTTISYKISIGSFVKLTVYDILGKKVRNLVNSYQKPNTYEVKFESKDLPSGVYFYRLETLNFTETKKFIILK